jgi:hypothetical protein
MEAQLTLLMTQRACTAGYVLYHGPREHVLDFFEPLGFRCPERKGIADFLQEVTSRKEQQVPPPLGYQPHTC